MINLWIDIIIIFEYIIDRSILMKLRIAKKEQKPKSQKRFTQNQLLSPRNNPEEVEIKQLKSQLSRKKQLIKLLERKCAKNIIICTRNLEDKVKQLQTHNCQLQSKLDTLTIELKNAKTNDVSEFKFQFSEHEELTQEEMKKVILFQFAEIQKLVNKLKVRDQKLSDYQRSNKELRKALLDKMRDVNPLTVEQGFNFLRGRNRRVSSSCQNANLNELNGIKEKEKQNSKKKKTGHRLTRSFSLIKQRDMGIQVESLMRQAQIQTQENEEMIQVMEENEELKGALEKSSSEMHLMREQISFLASKIQEYNHENEVERNNEVSIEYCQILQIFDISTSNPHRHEFLLQEITKLKTNMKTLINEVKQIESELHKLLYENKELDYWLFREKTEKEQLKEDYEKGSELLEFINEELMKEKVKFLSYKLQND